MSTRRRRTGASQWKDGYSATEQANAWLRTRSLAVPAELCDTLDRLRLGEVNEVFARPEHVTRLDDFGAGRDHDLFACARHGGTTRFVVGVEAKACEGFGGIVAERARAEPPSNKRAWCNLLSRALPTSLRAIREEGQPSYVVGATEVPVELCARGSLGDFGETLAGF